MMQVIKTCAALAVTVLLGGCSPEVVSRLDTGPDLSFDLSLEAAPDGYARLFSPAPHNFRKGVSEAGDPVRYGASSERYELRNGECGGDDCAHPRARAEIRITKDANTARIGQDIWYGYSFYNATVPSFRQDNSLRLVFGQWSVGGTQRPIMRFIQLGQDEGNFADCDPAICTGPNTTHGDLVVQLDDIAKSNGWGTAQNDGYVCRLFDMSEMRGKWVDMTINTNFSSGPDGYLQIWVNGQLACDYTGQMVSISSFRAAAHPEHRRGIFSSWDKRWRKATNDAAKPNLIVYYDEFRSGTSRAEVDPQFRITYGDAPLD